MITRNYAVYRNGMIWKRHVTAAGAKKHVDELIMAGWTAYYIYQPEVK